MRLMTKLIVYNQKTGSVFKAIYNGVTYDVTHYSCYHTKPQKSKHRWSVTDLEKQYHYFIHYPGYIVVHLAQWGD